MTLMTPKWMVTKFQRNASNLIYAIVKWFLMFVAAVRMIIARWDAPKWLNCTAAWPRQLERYPRRSVFESTLVVVIVSYFSDVNDLQHQSCHIIFCPVEHTLYMWGRWTGRNVILKKKLCKPPVSSMWQKIIAEEFHNTNLFWWFEAVKYHHCTINSKPIVLASIAQICDILSIKQIWMWVYHFNSRSDTCVGYKWQIALARSLLMTITPQRKQ